MFQQLQLVCKLMKKNALIFNTYGIKIKYDSTEIIKYINAETVITYFNSKDQIQQSQQVSQNIQESFEFDMKNIQEK